MTNLSGATTAVFIISLSAALETPVTVAWKTKDGTAKAGADYEAASGTVTFEPGETTKQIQVAVYGRAVGDTETRAFSIELYPPENAILDQTLTEVKIEVTDESGVAVTSLVVATGPRGVKGDPGLSSYELAKLQGYTGTLGEWIQKETAAGVAADRAYAEADRSEAMAERAEVAAEAAESKADNDATFDTVALGLAATAENGVFRVPGGEHGESAFGYYRKVSGAAVLIAKTVGYAAVTRLEGEIQAIGIETISSEMSGISVAIVDELDRRTWLEADMAGRPTERSATLIGEKLTKDNTPNLGVEIRDMDSTMNSISVAIVDKDDRRTWLEADLSGRPTQRSMELIGDGLTGDMIPSGVVDAITENVLNNLPPSTGGTAPVALSSARRRVGREYPTASKPLNAPIFSKADQSSPSLYWPYMFDARQIGQNKVYMYYSTDHATTHAASGIYLSTADTPLGPWTHHGLVFRDDGGGIQCETPSVVWDDANSRMIMFYQLQGGGGTGDQSTFWATSSDGISWTRQGIALNMVSANQPGSGHTGYFKPFRYADSWYGYSLYGASSKGRYAVWQSVDGFNWVLDPRLLGKMTDMVTHLPQYADGWFAKIFVGDVVDWRGRPWWIGLVGPSTSGGGSSGHRICAAPLRTDLRGFASRPVDITPGAQAWESNAIDYFGNMLQWGDKLYAVYRANTGQGGFGILEIN